VAQRAGLRASDADRERVAERLRHAAGEGRLLAHELEERLATALRAQTYGELDAVVSDLPGSRVAKRPRSASLARAHPIAAAIVVVAAAIVVLAAVAFVVTGLLAASGVWLVVAWFVVVHRHRQRQYRYRGGPPHGPPGRGGRGSMAGPPHADPNTGSWL
jgi:Flp pilus assembly protein TadB